MKFSITETISKVDNLIAESDKYSNKSDVKKDDIVNEVLVDIRRIINNEVRELLAAEFSEKTKNKIDEILLEQELSRSYKRIESEIKGLLRRGNLNLVLGIVASIFALMVLLFSVKEETEGIKEILLYYIPRVSIAAFIEVFSFFFLRLYRASLIDIKYYQNELTNIEFKIISIRLIDRNNKELITNVINEMIKTERNYVLKTDENTVVNSIIDKENSRDKNYADNIKIVIDSLSNLMNKK